jgi:hypothetical protein
MRVLKAVVPLVAGVAIAGSALAVSGALETKTAKVTGTIYTCNGAFGTTCRAEASSGLTIEFTELGLIRHTFSAVSQTDGAYVLRLPSGRYIVNLPRCKTYPFQASNSRYLGPPNFLREDWTIAADGSCSSATPLDQSP